MAGLLERRGEERGTRGSRGGERAPRNYHEANKDTYYRDGYGWVMSDADVEQEEEIKGLYDKEVDRLKTGKTEARGELDQKISQATKDVNSHYSRALAEFTAPELRLDEEITFGVKVVGGIGQELDSSSVEGKKYTIPKSSLDELEKQISYHKQSFAKDREGNYVRDPDGNYILQAERVVSGDGNPEDWSFNDRTVKTFHDTWADQKGKAQNMYDQEMQKYNLLKQSIEEQRKEELAGMKAAADKTWQGTEETYDTAINNAAGGYGDRVKEGAENFQNARKRLSESITKQDKGLLESPLSGLKFERGGEDGENI